MTKGILNLQMMGRFGNQAMQFLAAKAIAERDNLELRTPRWIGEKIFQIEPTDEPDYSGDYMHGYFQNQASAIYTLSQVRGWLKFQPLVADAMAIFRHREIVAHLRRGDFEGYNYPRPSLQSYYNACHKFGLPATEMCFVMEEKPIRVSELSGELEWVPDFWMMVHAANLFRANSSFSFVAGMLNAGRIFSPNIDGLDGGEKLVEFEEGNHCKLANHADFTDIRVAP